MSTFYWDILDADSPLNLTWDLVMFTEPALWFSPICFILERDSFMFNYKALPLASFWWSGELKYCLYADSALNFYSTLIFIGFTPYNLWMLSDYSNDVLYDVFFKKQFTGIWTKLFFISINLRLESGFIFVLWVCLFW